MKLYSDTLTYADLFAALPDGVELAADSPVPAKLRARRFDHVRLSTHHGNRWPNSGQYGGGRAAYDSGDVAAPRCATYDEHGEWMAELFDRDPRAVIVGIHRYDGRADFHAKTDGSYERHAVAA